MASINGFDPNASSNGATGSGFDVWDGTYSSDSNAAPHYGHTTSVEPQTPNMVDSVDYAVNELPKLSNAQLMKLQKQLAAAGYISQKAVTGEFNSVTEDGYKQFLIDVSKESARSGPITPDDYMHKILGNTPGGGDGFGGAQTNTSTTTNIATAQDARALALSTFQTLLGRRPSQHEMDAFYNALTAYDRAHPSVSTSQQTTGGTSADSTTNSTATDTGGANDQSFAQQYVDQNFGGQEGQHSALHYFDLVNSALTGPPPGVQHAV